MKTAIYINEGNVQLVLTPESDWERNATKAIYDGKHDITVMQGEFYDCQGGWIRQSAYATEGRSLMIRLEQTDAD